MKHNKHSKMLVALLSTSLLLGNCACAKKESTTTSSEMTTVETTTESTTVETTTESTTESTTEATTEATTTTEETTTTETTESETTATETTKKKKKKATETTASPAESTTKATAAPTETTPAQTTPAQTTTGGADISSISMPGDQSGTAKSAASDAVSAYCSSHSSTNANGEAVAFQFHDSLMSNQKSRAKSARNGEYVDHREVSGTFVPQAEAAASFGAFYCDEEHYYTQDWGVGFKASSDPSFAQSLVQNGSWHYYWCDHSGTPHIYSSMYDCAYALSTFLITEHTPQLRSDSTMVYYGVGCACKTYNNPLYEKVGIKIEQYDYYIYIGGDCPTFKDQHGY